MQRFFVPPEGTEKTAKIFSEVVVHQSILDRTNPIKFIAASCVVHAMLLFLNFTVWKGATHAPPPRPIQVKYIADAGKKLHPGRIVEAPKPQQAEAPRTSELLAEQNSRAHGNPAKTEPQKYAAQKTLIPKAQGSRFKAGETSSNSSKKNRKTRARKPETTKTPPLPEREKGVLIPTADTPSEDSEAGQKAGSGGVMALLDGFDAEKYTSIDTQSEKESADDEPISWDTTETKYASYFARIKHQIERVWTYPLEAAQKGIQGQLTLRFQISREGNLMDVRLVESSRYEMLDYAAIKAVKEAAPYYPFPVTIEKDKLSILATFVYAPNLVYSGN